MADSFSPGAFKEAMELRKRTLAAGKARKGQRAKNKSSRWRLEMELYASAQQQSQDPGPSQYRHMLRQCWIDYAYPPSTTPITALKPIAIADLRLETHHRGKVLFVRAFCQPVRVLSVQNAVEDEHGDVDRLALYNADPLVDASKLLPHGAIFAVKEPFYKTTADGGVTVRVDHPSDLVRLQPQDPLVPAGLSPRLMELDTSATSHKAEGNTAYARKDYLAAIDAYSLALDAARDDEQMLRYDVLRNRAAAHLCLKRYERTLDDARASIIPDTVGASKSTELNGKAKYRAGRAAYELGRFQDAEAFFKQTLALMPQDQDAAKELRRTAERLQQASLGRYNFNKMNKSASLKHNRLDQATFTSNVRVQDAGKRGRGLFATKDLKAGDLILCEKAFCVAFDSDEGSETYMILNLNTSRGAFGTHATLLFNVVQKVLHNPGEAARFFQLHDGGYQPKCKTPEVDGVVVVDTFQVQAIIEHNCFGCPTVSSTDHVMHRAHGPVAAADDDKNPVPQSAGLWITASYINHACDGNARRSFIGDMMMVRASKDIAVGQEITMPYKNSLTDVHLTQELQKTWGFKCDCTICTAEMTSSPAQRKLRTNIMKDVEQILARYKPKEGLIPPATAIAKAESLHARLQETYDKAIFQRLPRISLVELGAWLCYAHSATFDLAAATNTGLGLLRDLGFFMTITKHEVKVDRTFCVLNGYAVDAAMYAAHASIATGNFRVGRQLAEFAKGLYLTLHGGMGGFVEKYDDV